MCVDQLWRKCFGPCRHFIDQIFFLPLQCTGTFLVYLNYNIGTGGDGSRYVIFYYLLYPCKLRHIIAIATAE